MHELLSFFLTFWTTFAPLVLFLQILLKNLFKVLLQIVKGIWIKLQEAFSRFKIFSPCFKCFSFDLNKTPPRWNSPLSVQEGFTNWKKIKWFRYQFEKILTNWTLLLKTLKLAVVRSFCFGLYFSPPLALIAKNGVLREPFYFLLNDTNGYEWRLYQSGERCEVTAKGK
jgi:hypothetical protein